MFIGIIQALNPIVSPLSVYSTAFLPNMQLQSLVKLSLLANNSGIDINLSNLNEPVIGIKLSYLFLIAFVEIVILTLCILYMWPMSIAPQRDR